MLPIIKRAADLRRKIHASQPWGFRVASFFFRISSDIIDAFGRVVYAEFVKRGVQDLPDIGDVPALAWQDKLLKLRSRAGDKLPRSYGRKFGQMAWNVVLSKARNPEVVEDAMTAVIEKLLKNPTVIREGVTRAEAEGFVLKALKNEAIDLLRKQTRRREEGEFTRDIADPDTLRQLEDMLPPTVLREIIRDLDRVHPSAAAYVELVFQDYDDREIAQNAMLPHMDGPVSPQALLNWKNRWLPKIKNIIHKHLQEAA